MNCIFEFFFRPRRRDRGAPAGLEKLQQRLAVLRRAAVEAGLEARMTVAVRLEEAGEELARQLEAAQQGVKDGLLTREMQEALETIQLVLESLKRFDMEGVSYDGWGLLLLALVRQAQQEDLAAPAGREAVQPAEAAVTSEQQLEQFRRSAGSTG